MEKDTFSTYHPLINFVFYIGAFVFGMIFLHPIFLGCSLCAAILYYMTIKGKQGIKFVIQMLPVFVVLSVINPLFNTYGERILFTYFGGRPYTLEALIYGMALATMIVTVLFWFASYNVVMTSDKFLYLFGRLIPSVSLILTMILRLLPDLKRKMKQIETARKGIGLSVENGNVKSKVKNGMTLLSALTAWALEGGIVMADSMRSRGYGCTRRTSFSIYRFDKRDMTLISALLVLIVLIVFCGVSGGTTVTYAPQIAVTWNIYSVVGAVAYILFLMIPTIVNLMEDIKWHILKSGI